MSDEGTPDSRLSLLEDALKLEERLGSLEKAFQERGVVPSKLPWWRDSKTITILGALIAAVLPLLTFIDGTLKNSREAQRLLIEQQDKIRQNYLDRVLKPGITEGEQQRLFSLLAKLKSDPEFQEWANEELNAANQKVEALKREKEDVEAKNKTLQEQLDAELQQRVAELAKNSTGQNQALENARSSPKIQRLEKDVAQTQQRVTDLKERVGEPTHTDTYKIRFVTEPAEVRVTLTQVTGWGAPLINAEGTTPFEITLNRGIYRAVFQKSGYRVTSQFINVVKDDQIAVNLSLAASKQ
jgi:DNA repair exonuclease SbcCD ATPase subunit